MTAIRLASAFPARPLGDRSEVLLFVGLLLAMTFGLSLVPNPITLGIYGVSPTIAAGLVMLAGGDLRTAGGWRRMALGRGRGGPRDWAAAAALPALVLGVGYGAAVAFGLTGLGLSPAGSLAAYGAWWVILVPVVAVESLAEEVGWRGFLLPRLMPLGRVRTGLAMGLLWATWHMPLILIARVYHPGAGIVFLLLFAATLTALTFISNEMRVATDSIWSSAILHGSHNAAWGRLQGLVLAPSSKIDVVGGEAGIIPALLYGAVALWIIRRRAPWPVEEAARPDRDRSRRPAPSPMT